MLQIDLISPENDWYYFHLKGEIQGNEINGDCNATDFFLHNLCWQKYRRIKPTNATFPYDKD